MAESKSQLRRSLEPEPIERLLQPVDWFLSQTTAPGILLVVSAVIALVWANSPWGDSYRALFEATDFRIGFEEWALQKPLVLWINDALMALFFLLVGLEIKRELLLGELSSAKKAAMPIAAAVGGMAVPALIYVAFNWGEPSLRGWGVPMATDIAFAIGALALLGDRVPRGVRVFLVSLAIVDDLGALLVIALFYTEDVAWGYMGYAGILLVLLFAMNKLGVRAFVPYLLVGAWLWFFVFKSGVHATMAGVMLAMTIPAHARANIPAFLKVSGENLETIERESSGAHAAREQGRVRRTVLDLQRDCDLVLPPLHRLEARLHAWISFVVLPIFALANAGVVIGGGGGGGAEGATEALATEQTGLRVLLGVAIGLLVGKPIGVVGFSLLASKLGLGALPQGLKWRHILGAGVLAGIGFTMALFIAALAFTDGAQLNQAKLGILGASAVATVAGVAILWKGRGGEPAEQH